MSKNYLKKDGREDNLLLIAGLSPMAGNSGLLMYDGYGIERLDPLPTAGLALAGQELIRLLCSDAISEGSGDVLVYDKRGVVRYFRVEGLVDAHDIQWDGQSMVGPSPFGNAIYWVSRYGEHKRVWKLPGELDSWHVNGFAFSAGQEYCSAFGKFGKFREWNEHKSDHSGIIYNITETRTAVSGLDCPHNPVLLDEGWVVCNSGLSELVLIDRLTGRFEKRLALGGWTRGLTWSDQFYLVGESADRHNLPSRSSASVAIIDRRTWEVCARLLMPFTEITSLLLVPKSFAIPLRKGFRTNMYIENDYSRYSLFFQTGTNAVRMQYAIEPFEPEACRSRITSEVPQHMEAGGVITLDVSIENTGTAIWGSISPTPIFISYRWFRQEAQGWIEGYRTLLAGLVPPSYTQDCLLKVVVPADPGDYLLRISLVQEQVAWFDDIEPSNGLAVEVQVVHTSEPCPAETDP